MAGVIATIPKFQFSANGVPMVGGTLETYIAGSTTPATTWQDSALTIANSNPISLDARGECVLWLDPAVVYKFVLKNAQGVIQWTQDNISNPAALANSLRADLAAPFGAERVGYTPSGAGAVAKSVQDKLREDVCVFDFMTAAQIADVRAGTITTDTTAAINAAIASVSAIGGTVRMPAGRYKTTSTILLPTGVTLLGDGYLFAHSASWEGTTSIYAVHTGVAVLSLKGAVGCTVRDLSLEGDLTTHPKVALLLGRSSAASSGFHKIERVGAFGYFSVALYYSIASECNTWTDLYGWLFGGGGKYCFFTSAQDVFVVDSLVQSTNLDNVLIHPSLINSVNDPAAAVVYMEISQSMGGWTFLGGYFIPTAGSYVIMANGAIDGLSSLGPYTFTGVCGERLGADGNPSVGFNLKANAAVSLPGLTITGCRLDFLGSAANKQIFQDPNLTLVAPNIVMQPPEAFPYALTELQRSKIIGGVVSVGRYSAWTALPLEGTWGVALGAPYAAPGYSMDATGTVRLRGTVGGGTGTIFTLPPDYRPPSNMMFPVYVTGAMGRVLITAATGVVSLAVGTNTAEVDLSSITFRTTV